MVEVRAAEAADVPGILAIQPVCYPNLSRISRWDERHLRRHQANFPEGQLVGVEGDQVVAASASFITTAAAAFRPHTFREITQAGTFDSHDPSGSVLYGAEIMVLPEFRGLGIARRIYEERYRLVSALGLDCFAAGGRVPGFSDVKDSISIEQYVEEVVEGKRVDRVLTTQLHNGLRVVGILPDYLNDPKSCNYAALLLWDNPEVKSMAAAIGERSSEGVPMGAGSSRSGMRAGLTSIWP